MQTALGPHVGAPCVVGALDVSPTGSHVHITHNATADSVPIGLHPQRVLPATASPPYGCKPHWGHTWVLLALWVPWTCPRPDRTSTSPTTQPPTRFRSVCTRSACCPRRLARRTDANRTGATRGCSLRCGCLGRVPDRIARPHHPQRNRRLGSDRSAPAARAARDG